MKASIFKYLQFDFLICSITIGSCSSQLSQEVILNINVFTSLMKNLIFCKINCRNIVNINLDWNI